MNGLVTTLILENLIQQKAFTMHGDLGLSYSARKALCVQLGESAGTEVANLVQRLAAQIEELKRVKVNVTPVVPGAVAERNPSRILDMETF